MSLISVRAKNKDLEYKERTNRGKKNLRVQNMGEQVCEVYFTIKYYHADLNCFVWLTTT